ncbi:MAG: hypothetical protein FWG04_04645 [Desulfovibrionaceae bacterium]|nr:hypothetical protein [Desulfovibrionaceae bacterium]
MAPPQKKYTVESLTELIKQDPDKAFEVVLQMSKDEAGVLLAALPFEEYNELVDRAVVANLAANLAAKVETP